MSSPDSGGRRLNKAGALCTDQRKIGSIVSQRESNMATKQMLATLSTSSRYVGDGLGWCLAGLTGRGGACMRCNRVRSQPGRTVSRYVYFRVSYESTKPNVRNKTGGRNGRQKSYGPNQGNVISFIISYRYRYRLGKRPVRCTGRENMQIKKTENHLPSILLLNFFSLVKM
jgi:hypothetical protein